VSTGLGRETSPRLRVFFIGALTAFALPATATAAPASVERALGSARAPDAQLQPMRTITLAGGATIHRYRQRVDGDLVLGAGAVVNNPLGEAPALVDDSTRESIASPGPFRIDRSQAIDLARARASIERLRAAPSARLAIQPGDGGTLVWRVQLPAARPLGDFEVLVNARTGSMLAVHDLLAHFQTGAAKLYDPNPVAEQGGYAGLRSDHHDSDTKLLSDLRRRVTLQGIDDGQHCLRGQWATAKVRRAHRDVCRSSLDWRGATRANDTFEALMAYYHIDRTQRYIQSLQVGEPINQRSTTAYADSIREDNSFYSPFTKKLIYGSGGVDDAEDADVIIHEYGHAVQDSQLPGGWSGRSGSAMGEGFADYLAVTMSGHSPASTTKAGPLPEPNHAATCLFDWDGISYSKAKPPCGRRIGGRAFTLTKAESRGGPCFSRFYGYDVHCIGRVWSRALWDLRKTLDTDDQGRLIIDRDILASHFLIADRSPSFKQGGEALLQADENLYGGAHHDQIQAELQSRDIL
jgi:hypothetical protein